jgi:solute carrier family 9B (sodium/hydrogen exchanger), member 1/2
VPSKPLAVWWLLICTFLFSTTGAGLNFHTVTSKYLGYSALIIVVALIGRIATAAIVTYNGRFSLKERLFILCTWIPKATVQASLSAVFLTNAISHKLGPKYIEYGNIILSTAILAIVICAPIGAVLMNTFGPRLLPRSMEPETEDEKS